MAEAPYSSDRLVTVFGGSGFVGPHRARAGAPRAGACAWRCGGRIWPRYLNPLGAVGQIEAVQANLRYPESVTGGDRGRERGRRRHQRQAPERKAELRGRPCLRRRRDRPRGVGARGRRPRARLRDRRRPRRPQIPISPARGAARRRRAKPSPARPCCARGSYQGRRTSSSIVSPHKDLCTPALPPVRRRSDEIAAGLCRRRRLGRRARWTIGGGGATYELGGPEVMIMREAMECTLRIIQRKRALVAVAFGLSRLFARTTEIANTIRLDCCRSADFDRDEIELLKHDNLVSEQAIAEKRSFAISASPRRASRRSPRLSLPLPQDRPIRDQRAA